MNITLEVRTPAHQAAVDITHEVHAAVATLGLADGVVHVYVEHTTCGLWINENADPDVVTDVLRRLEDLVPWKHAQDRHAEGNTAAHVRAILVGSSVSVPVRAGQMGLGTWQGLYLAEFDGPRTRRVTVTALAGR